jgi:hypothetical protein
LLSKAKNAKGGGRGQSESRCGDRRELMTGTVRPKRNGWFLDYSAMISLQRYLENWMNKCLKNDKRHGTSL